MWAACGGEASKTAGILRHPSCASLEYNQLNSAFVAGETPLGPWGQVGFGSEVWEFIVLLLTRVFFSCPSKKAGICMVILHFLLPLLF